MASILVGSSNDFSSAKSWLLNYANWTEYRAGQESSASNPEIAATKFTKMDREPTLGEHQEWIERWSCRAELSCNIRKASTGQSPAIASGAA
jgi:hypothetical protein